MHILRKAQQTKFAVTPVHTQEEFDTLQHGCGQPGENFSLLKANQILIALQLGGPHMLMERTIFYKLKEHLESHQKIWQGLRKAQQSLVATREQRKPNRDRVRSVTHVSHVLPAASRKNPGVLPFIPSPPAPVDTDLPDFSDPPQGFISDQTEDNSGFTQELAAYDYSDIMPAASTSQQIQSVGSMHAYAPEFPPMQWNFPPYWNLPPQWNPPPQWEAPVQAPLQTNAVAGPSFITYQIPQEKPKRKRKCGVCIAAGRPGFDCPGESNRKRCKFTT
ncbi:hypothetical protein B0H11DRAFT_1916569 [Mycena galericulata]|nr:hypothetical protein B0H11DRAFT_1916569 [Mycena galericulata]